MLKTLTILLSLLLLISDGVSAQSKSNNKTTVGKSPVYNVMDYGAKGDGKNLDSPSVNLAIEAASKAGGGTVFFPAGTYLSGSIRLKSNIALYLDQGSTIEA